MSNWPSRDAYRNWAKRLMTDGKDDEQVRAETRMEIHLIKKYREEFEKERVDKGQ